MKVLARSFLLVLAASSASAQIRVLGIDTGSSWDHDIIAPLSNVV